MGLRDDLIAAKALIDTPSKFARGNSQSLFRRFGEKLTVDQAIIAATRGVPFASFPLAQALADQLPANHQDLSPYLELASHADIMGLFDRAIEAAP